MMVTGKSTHKPGIPKKQGARLNTPESLKTSNAINKLCWHSGACISPIRKQIIHAIKKKKRALDFSRPGRLEHGQTQGDAEIPSGYNVKCL